MDKFLTHKTAAVGVAALAALMVVALAFPAGAAALLVTPFQGCTTSLTPPVAGIGGSGTYSFNDAACSILPSAVQQQIGCNLVGGDTGTSGTNTPTKNGGAGKCHINASGTYVSIICGTGSTGGGATGGWTDSSTVSGDVGGLTPALASRSDDVTIKYGITFVDGIGVIRGTITSDYSPSGQTVTHGDLAGAALNGVIQITPTTGNCLTPVSQFMATGVVIAQR